MARGKLVRGFLVVLAAVLFAAAATLFYFVAISFKDGLVQMGFGTPDNLGLAIAIMLFVPALACLIFAVQIVRRLRKDGGR